MSQESSPLEIALDLLVYAPVGFALTVSEEVPKLAARGRSRVGSQIAAARVIGQLAVSQGRKLATRAAPAPPRSTPMRPAAESRPTPPTARAAGTATRTAPRPRPAVTDVGAQRQGSRPRHQGAGARQAGEGAPAPSPAMGAGRSPAEGSETAPPVTSLAIPGYDSLSASQVVQRLDGLSGEELEAVRRYEASARGRRTILARVSQLQSS